MNLKTRKGNAFLLVMRLRAFLYLFCFLFFKQDFCKYHHWLWRFWQVGLSAPTK
jgi:hypothetical protein